MSVVDEIIELRKSRLTYQEIADKVDTSKAYVGIVLNRAGQFGHLETDPVLLDVKTFDKGDDEIAKETGLSVYTVASARRNLGLKRTKPVNMAFRRNRFISSLFPGYIAGHNFSAIESFVIDNLSRAEASKVIDFYLISKDGLSMYSRFARSKARSKLKERVTQELTDKFVSEGIICPLNK